MDDRAREAQGGERLMPRRSTGRGDRAARGKLMLTPTARGLAVAAEDVVDRLGAQISGVLPNLLNAESRASRFENGHLQFVLGLRLALSGVTKRSAVVFVRVLTCHPCNDYTVGQLNQMPRRVVAHSRGRRWSCHSKRDQHPSWCSSRQKWPPVEEEYV